MGVCNCFSFFLFSLTFKIFHLYTLCLLYLQKKPDLNQDYDNKLYLINTNFELTIYTVELKLSESIGTVPHSSNKKMLSRSNNFLAYRQFNRAFLFYILHF